MLKVFKEKLIKHKTMVSVLVLSLLSTLAIPLDKLWVVRILKLSFASATRRTFWSALMRSTNKTSTRREKNSFPCVVSWMKWALHFPTRLSSFLWTQFLKVCWANAACVAATWRRTTSLIAPSRFSTSLSRSSCVRTHQGRWQSRWWSTNLTSAGKAPSVSTYTKKREALLWMGLRNAPPYSLTHSTTWSKSLALKLKELCMASLRFTSLRSSWTMRKSRVSNLTLSTAWRWSTRLV